MEGRRPLRPSRATAGLKRWGRGEGTPPIRERCLWVRSERVGDAGAGSARARTQGGGACEGEGWSAGEGAARGARCARDAGWGARCFGVWAARGAGKDRSAGR